jgi:hypothetical protein
VQYLDGEARGQTWVTFDLKGSAVVRVKDAAALPAVAWSFEAKQP